MRNTVKPLNSRTGFILVLAFVFFPLPEAHASAFEFGLGAYRFGAENKRNHSSDSLTGVGSYHIAYRQAISDWVELDVGYSVLATKTFGGDLAFGPDIGFNYFPLTRAFPYRADFQGTTIELSDRWAPYLGVSFEQRNFQSTSSQYAGAGVKAGVTYSYDTRFRWTGSMRGFFLAGPNQSTATQIDLLFGGIYQFR
jgi:hypothetical protein